MLSPFALKDLRTGSVATALNGFVYLALAASPIRVLRFDAASCALDGAFDSGLRGDAPMYFHTDRLVVASAPMLTPLYLECGLTAVPR